MPAVVAQIETPLGLQGLASAGANVVFPFVLFDGARGRPTEIEAQVGVDRNGDGSISDDEYLPATEDRLDPRNTRSNRDPQFFAASGDFGAANAFVWRSVADLGTSRYTSFLYKFTSAGRLIPDPAHPGEFLYDDAQAGVRLRIRTVVKWHRKKLVSDWTYTDAFSLDNTTAPSVTIDAVRPFASRAGPNDRVEITWTAYDLDSEDRNGNGVFDPNEDDNGNLVLDQRQAGVAFDFCRVLPPSDVLAKMLPFQLDALLWEPCTRAADEGDTDSILETDPAKAVYGTPYGRQWTFVWDEQADIGSIRYPVILRARAIDQTKSLSEYAYLRTPFGMDD